MKLARAFAALFFAAASIDGVAEDSQDWRYSVGVHDYLVPDVNSHTYGLNVGVSMDRRSDSGRHLVASIDIFLDRDKDHLDTDHLPIWWQIHLGSNGDFWRGDRTRVGWTADLNTRINTVSSIERQITALPAIVGGYDGQVLQASLEAGAGWFSLEIDDDAPRQQGYDRSGLRNSEFAYSAAAKLTLKLGDSWAISGQARGWWDSHRPLENYYRAALRMDANKWFGGGVMKQPAVVLSADYYWYNLAVYNQPNLPPILRWNDDLVIRLSLEVKW
jgi:hypothetical protein